MPRKKIATTANGYVGLYHMTNGTFKVEAPDFSHTYFSVDAAMNMLRQKMREYSISRDDLMLNPKEINLTYIRDSFNEAMENL